MRKASLMLVIVTIWITLGSCSNTETRYQSDPLSLPARPVLPSITAEELRQVADDVAWKIIERDRMRREYAEKLEAIIKATHRGSTNGR